MSVKRVQVPGLGTVGLYRRRDSRALKITIDHNDQIRVSMPSWLPYRKALEFAQSKRTWIEQHRNPGQLLKNGGAIGKAHRLEFVLKTDATQVSQRLVSQTIRVSIPPHTPITNPAVQAAARRGATKALRQESEALLPIRLRQLAKQHSFVFSTVSVKQLRSRWGSCTDKQHITLNLFLMQLPWPLIDYVLLHELTHTKHLHHGPDFWSTLEACLPTSKILRKQLRVYRPQL